MKAFARRLTVAVLAVTPPSLAAQNIQDLLARIERLERRVAELEGKSDTTPVAVATVAHEQASRVPVAETAPPEFPSPRMADPPAFPEFLIRPVAIA